MEFLQELVDSGVLHLHCPNCQGRHWGESGLGEKIFHCNTCFTHTPYIEWVTYIKRQGDDDPNISLVITANEEGLAVMADTSVRSSSEAESVRFVSGLGGRSLSTRDHLQTIAETFMKDSQGMRLYTEFKGLGGTLKIYQGKGDPDMWVKTDNILQDRYHGMDVAFPKDHEIVPYLLQVIEAIISDMRKRPIQSE